MVLNAAEDLCDLRSALNGLRDGIVACYGVVCGPDLTIHDFVVCMLVLNGSARDIEELGCQLGCGLRTTIDADVKELAAVLDLVFAAEESHRDNQASPSAG